MYYSNLIESKAVSELASTAMTTAVSKGVAKDVLYFNAQWSRNLAVFPSCSRQFGHGLSNHAGEKVTGKIEVNR